MKWFFLKSVMTLATAVTVAALLWLIRHQPQPARVQAAYKSTDKVILDRSGQVLDEIRGDDEHAFRHLNWVTLEQMPPELIEAVLQAEDRRFFYHMGFDPRGGETITMQLLNKIAPRPRASRSEKILRALALEMAWKKREILEAYLNLVLYRGELQGVAAASRALFDKAPMALTRPESAVLAALIHNPAAPIPFVRTRACRLLAQMDVPFECGALSPGHLAYLEEGYQIRPFISLAPFVAERLATTRGLPAASSLVRSTLDRQLQWQALHAVQKVSEDAAAIVLENATGYVLAYVSPTRAVDQVAVERQAGAALLPLLYARALDERVLTAATSLADLPPLKTRELKMRQALRLRAEGPALHVLDQLGVENFVHSLSQNGFSGLGHADLYGPSLATGGVDVRLTDVANAYRTLANEGEWSPLRFSPDEVSEKAPQKVFTPQAAFIVKDILRDSHAPSWRVVQEGTMTVGFSERYTVAVVGDRALWTEIMDKLEESGATSEPEAPVDVARVEGEWFIAGTEPHLKKASYITYPQAGSVIALDEDSSTVVARSAPFFIQIAAPQPDQNLYLNGRRLGRATARLPWEPQNGHYQLELRDSQGQVVHKVQFEVRGRRFAGL